VLAESPRYVLGHEYERVYVLEKDTGTYRELGAHYGDPECGIIDPQERWFLAGGEGLTFYTQQDGVVELLRGGTEADTYFVSSMRLEAEGTVRLLVDPWSDKASVWRFFPEGHRLEKLHDGPDLTREPWREKVDY
jgi:hypothetical protein